MATPPHRLGRFELAELLDENRGVRFERGIDLATGEPVAVQSVAADSPLAPALLANAQRVGQLGLLSRARLLAAERDRGRAFAAYRIPTAARSLSEVLDEQTGRPLTLIQRLSLLAALVSLMQRSAAGGGPLLALTPDTIWISPTLHLDVTGVIPLSTPAGDDRRHAEGRQLVDLYGAIVAGAIAPAGGEAGLSPATPGDAATVERLARLAAHLPGADDRPPDLAHFAQAIEDTITALQSPARDQPRTGPGPDLGEALEETTPPARSRGTPVATTPSGSHDIDDTDADTEDDTGAVPAGAPPDERPLVYDENVQFTVYRPRTLTPGHWQTMLAFAHLAERRPDAPADSPDPQSEVARQAHALLQDPSLYRSATEDSGSAIPRDGEISFVPEAPGVEFNPRSVAFRWSESVHRADFRLRATAGDTRTIHGRLSVYLGALLLAEINMTFAVGERQAAPPQVSSARPYRRIFASYSHRDHAIVAQYREYAQSFGDRYLQDVFDLRSGERWQPALEQLIRDADVFQLFWSWPALESPYVQQEWRFALGLHRPSFIRPVYWETPLPSRDGLPPKELTDLQFAQISRQTLAGTPPSPPQTAPPSPAPASPAPATPRDHTTSSGSTGMMTGRPPIARRHGPLPKSDNVTLGSAAPEKSRLPWRALSIAAMLIVLLPGLYFVGRPDPLTTFPSEVGGGPPSGSSTGGPPAPPTTTSPSPTIVPPPNAAPTSSVEVQVANFAVFPAALRGRLALRLRRTDDGRIVASAEVDASGIARFTGVPEGTYVLDTDAAAAELASPVPLTVGAGGTRASVTLLPHP